MKYKDHVYDEDLKKATIWLEQITIDELIDLVLKIKEQGEESTTLKIKKDYDREKIIFGGM